MGRVTSLQLARILRAEGLVTSEIEWTELVCIVTPRLSWAEIAQMASLYCGGKWSATAVGAFSLGGGGTRWLMSEEQAKKVRHARKVCESITGEATSYSIAGNAGKCLAWAVPPRKEAPERYPIMGNYPFGYHECRPGNYRNCELLDMKSCYNQLLSKLETLRYKWVDEQTFVGLPQTKEETQRAQHVFSVLDEEEEMRRALWGKCLGTFTKPTYYLKGVEYTGDTYWGLFPTAALLVARMACELTHIAAAQTGAFYAQTDGIICKAYSRPYIWEKKNMVYRVKSHGDARIRGQHVYHVEGSPPTKWYRKRDTFRQERLPMPIPKTLFINRFI